MPKNKESMPKREKLVFFQSVKSLKSDPGRIGKILLFDALFVISFYALWKLFFYFNSGFTLQRTLGTGIIFLILSLIYYMIILFIYSFFKFCILDFVGSIGLQPRFSLKGFLDFCLLNIVILGVIIGLMLAINFVLYASKPQYKIYVFAILGVPFLIFSYLFTNFSQQSFYSGLTIKKSIKKGIKFSVTRNGGIILTTLVLTLIFWLLIYLPAYTFNLLASSDFQLYLAGYSLYAKAMIILSYIAAYLIILINRVSFYLITKNSDALES